MAQGPGITFTGRPTQGVDPAFLARFIAAARAAGVTKVNVESGYRSPAYNAQVGGAPNSNHTRGLALDTTVFIPGRGWIPGGLLSDLAGFGLRSGNQPGFFHGAPDPNHVDAGYNAHSTPASPPPGQNSFTSGPVGWPASAALAYQLALNAGLNKQQAKDFAAVQYGESGFNPIARNKQSGAAGLYQLLSSGYVNKANQLGGVFNPRANILAILPNYVAYYKSHPNYVPGAAGATVEASGEPASYYAQGLQHLGAGAPGGGGVLPQPTPGAPLPQQLVPPTPRFDPRLLSAVQTVHQLVGLPKVGPDLAALLRS